MAITDQNKLCKITNNSGKDIEVTLFINADETASQNAVAAANQQLEILTLSEGGTIIKNGSTGTVTLNRSYKPDADTQGYVPDYNLVLSDSNWLYPLANLPVSQQTNNGSPGFDAVTVSAANLTPMSQAISFYQTMAAFPDSQLSKDYITALQSARNTALAKADGSPGSAKTVSDAIADTMNNFFKGTTEYTNVTLADVVTIDNYYNNFPSAWAQYENSMTYYLYGSDGTTSAFAGTLSLKKSGAIDVTKPNGGYTCSFSPAINSSDLTQTAVDSSNAVNLTYTDGLFVEDPKAANPKIALRGSFLLKRIFTTDPTDNTVVSVISGTVNGKLCIGFDTAQTGSKPVKQLLTATASFPDLVVEAWNQLTHPKTLKEWVISIMTLIGAVALIPATAGAIYGIYRVIKYKAAQKAALPKSVVEDGLNKEDADVKGKGVQWGGNDEEALAAYHNLSVDVVMDITNTGAVAQALSGGFFLERDYVEELLKYSSVLDSRSINDLQGLLSSMRESEKAASKAVDETIYKNPELLPERKETIRQELQNLAEYQESFQEIYAKVQHQIDANLKVEIDESISTVNELSTSLTKAINENKSEESELDPKVEEEIRPAELV